MAKPVIGLTGPSLFTADCVDTVEELLGGEPLLLYMNKPETIEKWVKACDAVVLAGGVDIHPSVYDTDVYSGQNLTRFDLNRDLREIQILDAAFANKKPVFGICRGHQVIGVTKGLQLVTDLSGGAVCHQPSGSIDIKEHEPTHSVDLVNPADFAEQFEYKGSPERSVIDRRMAPLTKKLWVNSFHHQGLKYSGSKKNPAVPAGVEVYATAYVGQHEGVNHIIELMGGPGWLSSQWHPEHDWRTNTASRCVLEKFRKMF